MLRELSVQDIAIIDQSTIELRPGLTALTGETGAGKSLLIDSIGLALGGRADSDLVRAGAAKGSVRLVAEIGENPAVLGRCQDLGIEPEDGLLVISRDVSAEGRSTVRINGRLVSVGSLREIGALLVDLHGQHDHQSLLDKERQGDFLDGYIGEPVEALLAELRQQFEAVQSLQRKLTALRSNQREREQRADMLRFQIDEITAAELSPGETAELEARLSRLKHAEKLGTGVYRSLESLSDDEGSILERLGTVVRLLESLEPLDPELSTMLEPLRQAEIAATEASRSLREYAEALDVEPDTLEQVAARLDLIVTLKRKYGESEAEILAYLEQCTIELDALTEPGSTEEDIVARLLIEQGALEVLADRLTALRTQAAQAFQNEVEAHIRDLAMEKAIFEVSVTQGPIQATGQDTVEFFFSSNPGEPTRPLNKVASGGELSRVMLAIKVASAGRAGVPSLIFDEVDAGLSGRAAAVTARKLEQLADHCQVIVISHLPQIAGRAEHHFIIEKGLAGSRTLTSVREVSGDERVAEIARMLAGEQVGESALANAAELLAPPRR